MSARLFLRSLSADTDPYRDLRTPIGLSSHSLVIVALWTVMVMTPMLAHAQGDIVEVGHSGMCSQFQDSNDDTPLIARRCGQAGQHELWMMAPKGLSNQGQIYNVASWKVITPSTPLNQFPAWPGGAVFQLPLRAPSLPWNGPENAPQGWTKVPIGTRGFEGFSQFLVAQGVNMCLTATATVNPPHWYDVYFVMTVRNCDFPATWTQAFRPGYNF